MSLSSASIFNCHSLCNISLFSLGFMALYSLLYRYVINLMDFLKFLWSAVEYFSSSPEVQVKLALLSILEFSLQFSTLLPLP